MMALGPVLPDCGDHRGVRVSSQAILEQERQHALPVAASISAAISTYRTRRFEQALSNHPFPGTSRYHIHTQIRQYQILHDYQYKTT